MSVNNPIAVVIVIVRAVGLAVVVRVLVGVGLVLRALADSLNQLTKGDTERAIILDLARVQIGAFFDDLRIERLQSGIRAVLVVHHDLDGVIAGIVPGGALQEITRWVSLLSLGLLIQMPSGIVRSTAHVNLSAAAVARIRKR